ncbi:GNAT family N-acetyltransferase [Clostridium gasigenes]|uniref:Acetyltransferase (GNAT) family protein n=1 Tax=Clostridium gasigenes TaxID=94869 RepID=A0A1H0UBN9_9CLOT|nr:GNAT family N-acetyltransferase [Clostridium gasigenes]MBB6621959.1 GNAT family N-acetyltransferase [Clostridium gasigenes]MBU3090270.1 GNAT family N-acetyltransferase [Clostridium gasigenes]SDP63460.1 Acetyltransferase (GNAT) family protein [Clostridium gasigenes]
MLKFELLEEKDIEILTPIMEKSFDEDARIHLNEPKGGPPGYDNGDFLREYGLSKEATSYKISLEGTAIGCVILWINNETKINFLGNIFIDVSLQNKGLGKRVWRFIEEEYPNTIKWCTDTPGFSKRNHNFYVNKCGFHIVRIENPMDKYECSYIMEKEINLKY